MATEIHIRLILRRPVLQFLALAAVAFASPALGETNRLRATPADRTAVESCLKLVDENAKQATQKQVEDETPGPAGRLAAAAREAATQSESCIGAVTVPCQQEPGGYSTAGMIDCNTREWAVWDERLNRTYNSAIKGAERKLATALRQTQRAWLQWREQKCKLPEIENEGGSIIGPLYTGCMLDSTARQALWLDHR